MPLLDRRRFKFPLFRLRVILRNGTEVEIVVGPTAVIIWLALVELVKFLLRR